MHYEEHFNDQYTLVYTHDRDILFSGHLKEKPEVNAIGKTKEELIEKLKKIVAEKDLKHS